MQEILAQQVALTETYLLIFERQDLTTEEAEAAATAAAAAADEAEDDALEAALGGS